MLIAAGRRTVLSTEYGEQKNQKNKSQIFIIQKQNSSFGNSYSNLDFLIITKNSGGLAAMRGVWRGKYECDCNMVIKAESSSAFLQRRYGTPMNDDVS